MSLKLFSFHNKSLSIRGRLALVSFLIISMTAIAVVVNSTTLSHLEASIQTTRLEVAARHDILTSLHKTLGYGGAIHHFKNYVLRGERHHASQAEGGFSISQGLIDSYHQFELSVAEERALTTISETIGQYQKHLTLEALKNYRLDQVAANDSLVKVDDSAALMSLGVLNQELELLRDELALNSAKHLQASNYIILTAGMLILVISVFGLSWVYRSVQTRINHFLSFSNQLKKNPNIKGSLYHNDEFGQIATNYREVIDLLEQERQKAEQSDRAKTAFLATVSHEVRTPMNGVIGLANLLAKTDLNQEQSTHLKHLLESGEHMLALVDEILDFSKIEQEKVELDVTDFSFSTVLDSLHNLYLPQAKHKGLDFYINSDVEEDRWYRMDKKLLRQIMHNLTSNAIKFTPHGCIEINIQEWEKGDTTELYIEVRDTGIGIDIDDQKRIFQPFEQADASSTRTFGGTGLGLSIVRSLAKLMNGEVAVSSFPGAGSRFTVTLEVDVISPTEQTSQIDKPLDYRGMDVLLVEDNEVNIIVIQNMLEQIGFNVTVAKRGKYGVDLARRYQYDLILMDHHMPEMSGLAATRLIRQISLNEKTLILGCTADVFPETRQQMLAAGVDGIISKPVIESDLMEWLQRFSSKLIASQSKQTSRDKKTIAEIMRMPPKHLMLPKRGELQLDFIQEINLESILRSLSLPEELFPKFAVTILEDSNSHLIKLEHAAQQNDFKQVVLHSHTLKGTWRSLAIWPLVRLSESIQMKAQKEVIDPTELASYIRANKATLDQIERLFEHRKAS